MAPKEVVVVFAIQQGGEVSGAILAKNGKGETRRGGAAGNRRRNREDALGRLVIADQPIDAVRGEAYRCRAVRIPMRRKEMEDR